MCTAFVCVFTAQLIWLGFVRSAHRMSFLASIYIYIYRETIAHHYNFNSFDWITRLSDYKLRIRLSGPIVMDRIKHANDRF